MLSARNIINGEDLSSVDKYDFHKMVTFPGDKEEETDKNEIAEYEAKGYWVSYGSVDEKVESAFESLCWTDGNIIYNLGGIDTEIGEDGMKAMKNEIMKAE